MSLSIDLSGQTVLVTGASRGIGAAIARAAATAGARVLIHYGKARDAAEALAREIGNGAAIFQADLGQPQASKALWGEANAVGGPIHALVNNAGIAVASPIDGDADRWLDDWNATMAINLMACAALCREALLHFQQHGGGRIVNISSRAAHRGDTPDYLAYAASKAGVAALTKSIARGFGRQGIKAFTIAPGFTRTRMAQAFIEQYGEAYAVSDIALGVLTEPDDIAPMIAFLLSGLCDHATGTTIDINGASYVR